MAGAAVRGGRHRRHGRGDPAGQRRRAAAAVDERCVAEARRSGTTTIEIKSGYGLSTDDEARLLRDRRRADHARRRSSAPTSCPTSTPGGPTTTSPSCAARCSTAAPRTPAGSTRSARPVRSRRTSAGRCSRPGARAGLGLRLHANQLGPGDGCRAWRSSWAARRSTTARTSPTTTSTALAGSATVATFLPATDFSTRQPYPDARRVLDAGVTVALAANCNPGSSYTTSMPFCIALAVRDLGMTPDEAILAATAGGAAALRRDRHRQAGSGMPRRPHRPRRPVADRLRVPARGADRRDDDGRRRRRPRRTSAIA